MRVALDAYAVIAFLISEPARPEVEPLLRDAIIAAPNLAEVLDVCTRVHGNAEGIVRERLGWLLAGGLEVAALDAATALDAGALRAKYYRKRECEISMGDCLALSEAKRRSLPLATADPSLAMVARTEQVGVIGLPNTRGERP